MQHAKEETAVVLDFLPNGYPFDDRPNHLKTPVAQALGKTKFILLELVPKKGVGLQPNEEVYIGEGKRDKIHHINGKIGYDKLTSTARNEIEYIIKDIITKDESRFISFFNTARPLTTRMHQLELLPGFGKKHMWEIINERDNADFTSFADLKKRVKLLPDPEKAVLKRMIKEIEGNEKYRLFTQG
ncbi:MAG: DUF655 domain-containing protein [Candidatus Woesearchaeota archaeon]